MIGAVTAGSSGNSRRLGGCFVRSALFAGFLLLAVTPGVAWAHAGLVGADPVAGAALGASPTSVRLSFSERPQASLSRLRVLDRQGRPVSAARPGPATGDPLSLTVPVPKLGRSP